MSKIEITEITQKTEWQKFVQSFDFYTFLQSWEWSELQKQEGVEIFRLGGYVNSELIFTALVLKIKAKRGTFLLIPHGPMIKDLKHLKVLTNYLNDLGKKEKADFIRLSPILLNTKDNSDFLKSLGYKFAPMHVHAETTWLLDLHKTDNELLKDMRKTTRYIIHRAEKEGVIVKKDNSAEAIDKFIAMHQKHAKENSYEAFSGSFIKKLFTVFKEDQISLKFAYFKNFAEAASIVIYYGHQAVYYLAATDTQHPKFSPSYYLQWQSILEAKEKNCFTYNFWGVSPDDNPKHPIYGVSAFKRGFGGYKYDLLHAHDYPLTNKYFFNYIIETFRRIKRKYYYIKP